MQVNCSDRLILIRWEDIEDYISGKDYAFVGEDVSSYITPSIDKLLRLIADESNNYAAARFVYFNGPDAVIVAHRDALDFAIDVASRHPKNADIDEIRAFYDASRRVYEAAKTNPRITAIAFYALCAEERVAVKALVGDEIIVLADESVKNDEYIYNYECIIDKKVIEKAAEAAISKIKSI